jgi:ribosomal protein S7
MEVFDTALKNTGPLTEVRSVDEWEVQTTRFQEK